jgi:integrase
MTFLKANGILGLVGKNDWPRYTEEEPEMYELEELEKLFNEQERLWFEFFFMTGMREQEVMHLFWSDINFAASTVRVSHKPDADGRRRPIRNAKFRFPQSS